MGEYRGHSRELTELHCFSQSHLVFLATETAVMTTGQIQPLFVGCISSVSLQWLDCEDTRSWLACGTRQLSKVAKLSTVAVLHVITGKRYPHWH